MTQSTHASRRNQEQTVADPDGTVKLRKI